VSVTPSRAQDTHHSFLRVCTVDTSVLPSHLVWPNIRNFATKKMPSQVFVSVTPAMRDFLRQTNAAGAADAVNEDAIDLDQIYRLANEHQKLGGKNVKVHELLEGSEVVSRVKTAESEMTDLERLRSEAEERKYQRMVEGVAPLNQSKKKSAGAHIEGLSFATNFGTQVLVAFIGAFALGYFFVETFVAPDNSTLKVIAGAACSFLTLLLETCLLMVHESKEEMIARKQRQRDEKAKEKRKAAASAAATAAATATSPSAAAATGQAGAEESGSAASAAAAPVEGKTGKSEAESIAAESQAAPKTIDEKKKD